MKKKILFILHLPPPIHGASMVGQYIRDSHLLHNRFDSEYINMTSAADLNDIGHVGVKKLVSYGKMLWRVRKSINSGKPNVIYITPNSAGKAFYKDFVTVCLIKYWVGSLLSNNTKILVHYHNKGVREFSKSWFNDWLYKKFFADLYVLLLGRLLYEDVKKYVPANRVFFCGNGLPELASGDDEAVVNAFRKKQDNNDIRPIHILFLSNMMVEKGVWTLVDACKILKDKGVSFKCTFVGGWKDISEDVFTQKVISIGLDASILAVGPKYGDEKEKYWLDADVFVFPTFYHNECFPLVLLEAMQHVLPCISTCEGAIPDIIDEGETGFVIDKKNPDQLAAKIQELANNKERRLKMGLNGYQKFKDQYTLKVFENRLCDILEILI